MATKVSDPDTAMPSGPLIPEMSEALTVVPDVVYSSIVPPRFVAKMSEPDTAMPIAPVEEMGDLADILAIHGKNNDPD